MRLLVVAVGQKLPAWAETACEDYLKRFPPDCRAELRTVKTEPRNQGKPLPALLEAERERLEAQLPRDVRRVILDERGQTRTTVQLAQRLQAWQADGRDVALVIGGPDGLSGTLKSSADETLRLSDLTLPHALARVLLVEALYRAWSVTVGHPYHRE